VVSKLQQELKQTKPFASKEEEASLNIVRTAEWLLTRVNTVFKPMDLTNTQYNALRILRGAGADGASCGEIGERMVTAESDITRLLDRLEARGLITRCRGEKDRRVVRARITVPGLQLLSELDQPVDDRNRELLGHLGERDLATLIRLLESIRQPE
jgi:DNA-binding MarR family transcriptional regulator